MKYKKEDLEKLLILENKSYESIGRLYSVSGAAIKKAASRLGLVISNRRKINKNETFNKGVLIKSKIKCCLYCNNEYVKYPSHGGKYCSFECQHKDNNFKYITKWKNGDITGLIKNGYSLSIIIRKYIFEKNGNKCEKCGWCEINKNTELIPLQIHHIDGDCQNNKEDNLQLLCPNCHSLTENFGSRNKNATSGRSEYFNRGNK